MLLEDGKEYARGVARRVVQYISLRVCGAADAFLVAAFVADGVGNSTIPPIEQKRPSGTGGGGGGGVDRLRRVRRSFLQAFHAIYTAWPHP